MQFKKYDRSSVDLFQHCLEQKVLREDLSVHIGCDSILVEHNLYYFTVVAFRYNAKGAHFIYDREKRTPYRDGTGKPDIFTKLWEEARFTIELSELLVERGIFNRDELVIEFDYNDIIKTVSTKLIPSATGWAIGLGYKHIILKSESQTACKAANHLCQKLNP